MQVNNKIAENISILGVNPALASNKLEENNSFKNVISDELSISETFFPSEEIEQENNSKPTQDLSDMLLERKIQSEEDLEDNFIELLHENKSIEINNTTSLAEQKADIKKGNVNPVHNGVVTLKQDANNASDWEVSEKISRYTKPYNDGSNYAEALDLYL